LEAKLKKRLYVKRLQMIAQQLTTLKIKSQTKVSTQNEELKNSSKINHKTKNKTKKIDY